MILGMEVMINIINLWMEDMDSWKAWQLFSGRQ